MASGLLLIVFVGLFLSQSTEGASDHWGYPDLDVTDVFPQWGGICDTGKAQSPIDLSIAGSLKGSFPDLNFNNYDKVQSSPSLVNNGHTVQLSQFSVPMTLSGGPLSSKYVVEQIHLHWWSEHTIDQIRYPMEVHIVHRNTRYANMTVAANYKDGISVVGVLYHVSNEENSAIAKIAENINFINEVDEVNKPVLVEQKLSVREFFPKISSGYMTYAGSLTTPSCAESVTWFVLLDTFPVTLEQVNQFKTIQIGEGKALSNNYREIQKKNNRAVVVVQGYRSAATPLVSSSILAIITAMGVVGLRRITI